MEEGLKLYKVRFNLPLKSIIQELTYDGTTFTRIIFAKTPDEAWRKFDFYAEKRSYNLAEVCINELSEEEMKQIEILVPFYKEYTA